MKGRRSGLLALLVGVVGCDGATPPTAPPAGPVEPLAIHRPDSTTRVFSGADETPGASYLFAGASGSVRVTMEVEGTTASAVPTVNDVLFRAQGDGRISVAFKRPWPGHPDGRVTIACRSGEEESSSEFEPELWYHKPGAIVTFEPPGPEPIEPVAAGKEIVLGRYVARNVPRDVRVSFKAVFAREPVAPRTKAGAKPPR